MVAMIMIDALSIVMISFVFAKGTVPLSFLNEQGKS